MGNAGQMLWLGFSGTLIIYGLSTGVWAFLHVKVDGDRERELRVELSAPLRAIKAEVGAYLAEVDPALATMEALENRIVENLTRSLEDFDDSKDYTRHVLSASVKRVVEKFYDKMIDARIDDELRVHDDLAVKEIFDS